jgi:hypothetical protein
MQLSRQLVIKALGDVDEAVIAKIPATSASAEDLAQGTTNRSTAASPCRQPA